MDPETFQDSKENIKFISDNILYPNKCLGSPPHYLTPSYPPSNTNMILENNLHSIFMEHCYSRPHTWRPETHFLRPTKTLFIRAKAADAIKDLRRSLSSNQSDVDVLDVDTVEPEKEITTYDDNKARFLMDECERHAKFARIDEGGENPWEDTVSKAGWTANQNRLFDKVVEILDAEHAARLAYKDAHNEAVIRRSLIEKTVKRYRWLMSTVSWDLKLSQWLHQVLTDYTSTTYLAIYLDMLQTLKSKLPTFTDRLMFGPNQLNRVGVTSTESLFPLLKRRWDPFSAQPQQSPTTSGSPTKHTSDSNKGPTGIPKRLPGNAVIVIVPGAPTTTTNGKRLAKWITLLNQLAPVYPVFANLGSGGSRMTILTCLEQMFASTRAKVQEVKADNPNRNLILVGVQGAGAALALQVAQVENVLCCVCIGFGVHTADGRRGQPDDQMMELQSPVLFVVGQCATTARQEEMEDLRERMRVETGLLMVGGADDYLRLSKKKRRAEGVTQSFVDRCVVEEIGNFASDILLSPYPPQMRQSPTHQTMPTGVSSAAAAAATAAVRNFAAAHMDHNRKRNNSNGSSLDSEPPSPLPHMHHQVGPPKVTRPVGRPPGSTSKARINTNAKWGAFSQHHQQQQGTHQSSTPSPTLATQTPTPSSTSSAPPPPPPPNVPPPAYPDYPQATTKMQQPQQQQQQKQLMNANKVTPGEKNAIRQVTPEKQKGGASCGGGIAKSPTVSAKLQALATRGVISHNIVNTPSGIRTIPPKSSTIKVLNHITIATSTPSPIGGLPKPTHQPAAKPPPVYTQRPSPKPPMTSLAGGTTFGSLVLMPDGKLARSCGTSSTTSVVKGLGSTPMIFPLNSSTTTSSSSNNACSSSASANIHFTSAITVPPPTKVVNASAGSCVTAVNRMRPKFITSKTQLITNRLTGQKQLKTIPYIQTNQATTLNASLPPPTNLTSQEIMDLPIIFADDDSTIHAPPNDTQTNQLLTIPSSSIGSKPQGKLVIVKPSMAFAHNLLKRPSSQSLQKPPPGVSGVKYTKIILSKCPPIILNDDQKNKQSPIGTSLQVPTDLSIRREVHACPMANERGIKVEEPFDLEKELVATAVVKPSCCNVDPKRMTFIYKGESSNAAVQEHISTCTNAEIKKMLQTKEEI